MTSLDNHALRAAPALGAVTNVTVLEVDVPSSELDAATVGALDEALQSVSNRAARIPQGDPCLAVVDLEGVELLTASAVRVLVDAACRLRAEDIAMVVRRPSRFARRVIALCGASEALGVPPP